MSEAALQAQIDLLKSQLVEKNAEISTKDRKIGQLETQLSHFKTLSKALQLRLSCCGSIDAKEEEIIPTWLRNSELSRSQKFHLSVHFKLTYEATILAEKLEDLKLESSIFGSKIGQLYDKWGKDYHGRKLKIPTTEIEWIELFTELEIDDRLGKKSIKALLSYDDVMTKDDTSFKRDADQDDSNKGFVFVENIAWKAKSIEIKRFIKSKGIVVYDVIHLMTDATDEVPMRPSGVIVVFLDDIEKTDFVSKLPNKFLSPNLSPVITEKVLYAEN